MSRLILLIAIAAMPAAATAATIDFNSVPQNMLFGPTYSEKGFTLTGTGFEFPQSDGWAYSTYANDGTLTFNYKGPTYTLTKDGGGIFNFTSLDLGNVNNDSFGGTLRVAFDGGTPTALAIPITSALQTYTLGMAGVTSVAFSFLPGETANNTLNSYARIDNLVVGGAVPEPTSWAMMIAGFGLVGVARRARKPLTVVT
ncbi:PEPxxWA-CTERM sorting domain-containing protein (plasmid) [Polymorphobacter sp. PAMC 29334]|uniref:PEPxxWA-CTERM sorting domain-containing protein n=1 Tax=Polymorphobacter sp. PAMC 29334 TaxID=2862331 RepID=UPI001C78FD37|nr:PEPxxWA-CTERM sorting domain-containing protein [Polymorphobacter sp. PAMC 29334]QYE33283.1 PEPxxWA-CTERM sorting domain-containing protein [Polymorphobacter sp. PAMC 29334]